MLILVSHQSGRPAATVRSRCRLLRLPTPSIEQALPWLRTQLPGETDAESLLVRAGRRPLRALVLASGDLAGTFARLQELIIAVADGSMVPAAAAAVTASGHFDTGEALGWLTDFVAARAPRLRKASGRRGRCSIFDRLATVRREHVANANLNAELAWGEVWQDWRRAAVAGG
ncbi:MAG: hypothetical protein IPK48_06375 [Gammaproteobacteria bacterium]|nr:hypothetical protein [Gammaproteobacteria bacterium]